MHREPPGSKPEPVGKPLVWADTRQALTETLSYFKKPQGGCYSKDGHIYGFLLDGVSRSREYMSADVVISRQGGGMGPDGKIFAQTKDHHISDAQATSFQNNIVNQNPVVLIVGKRNTAMHIAVPHTFCVLDFYKPMAIWTEKTQGAGKKVKNTVKYRFERLRGNGDVPWHAVKDSPGDIDSTIAGSLAQASCISCHNSYPQVYLCRWMCLNGDCDKFWKVSDDQDAPTHQLLYNPAFLLDRTPWPRELPSWPLRPALPDTGKVIGDNLLYVNSRGLCCPRCGRCTQRYKFSGWVCDNPDCVFPGVSPQWSVLKAPQLHRPWDIVGDGIPHTRNKHRADRGVTMAVEYRGDWKISRYRFDGVNGQLLHVSPTRRLNSVPGGADDMLAELQRASFMEQNAISLERRRFKGNKGSGKTIGIKTPQKTPQKSSSKDSPLLVKSGSDNNEPEEDSPELNVADDDDQMDVEDGDFMGAFSINYGWPYKFIATGASESFDDAPRAIRASRSMLQWAAQEFLGPAVDGHDDFNEELVFTYMQDQKLGYHDDGEYGLGPRIGTMTLGGPAQMNIRLKMKHFAGCSKETKIFTYERPLPKCYYAHDRDKSGWYQRSYEQRVAGFEELEKLKSTNPQKFKIRSREIPQEIGMHLHCRRYADDIVNLTLRHGDIIFMEGYDIQKYFEHGVQAEGFLRYALTCRKVLPAHLELKDHPKYEVGPDDYGYIGPVFDD
ncbi:hypothetical protein K431DRAFT_261069 [Polychaeton citri CBS 116435]|uniref:Alpha-ketoglutarate-dependent dioxygenase AlkB-like domain-containing protein n=1 Tax=Polychaeton citri CBS 116435 TaxID=1314669 RepID=A0A9P4QDR4_9PEZI|nr:hypothetical protein K431DRAFT_261069 [Polychaeton citri CBS 116435]